MFGLVLVYCDVFSALQFFFSRLPLLYYTYKIKYQPSDWHWLTVLSFQVLFHFYTFFFTQLHSDKKQIRLVLTFNNSFVEVVTERNSNLLSVLRLTPFSRREKSLIFLLRHGRCENEFWRGGGRRRSPTELIWCGEM